LSEIPLLLSGIGGEVKKMEPTFRQTAKIKAVKKEGGQVKVYSIWFHLVVK
jgi:hypothetical protein